MPDELSGAMLENPVVAHLQDLSVWRLPHFGCQTRRPWEALHRERGSLESGRQARVIENNDSTRLHVRGRVLPIGAHDLIVVVSVDVHTVPGRASDRVDGVLVGREAGDQLRRFEIEVANVCQCVFAIGSVTK
jgi:hypothetical protein